MRQNRCERNIIDNCFPEGPIILEPVRAINVLEKDNISLQVAFETDDDVQIKWYRNNQLLEQSDECDIVHEEGLSKITILNADKKKAGKYEVIIESNNKVVKSASTVKLSKPSDEIEIQPPVFIKLLEPKKVFAGEIVLLQTEVISNPSASFQWYIDTNEVTSYAKQNKLTNIYVSNKENLSCLCIENINNELVGVITCRAENFAGSVSCSATLSIEDIKEERIGHAPKIIKPLNSITVMDGEPIIINCEISGQPWPKIEWYHNNQCIPRARDITVARQESGLCELCIKEAFPEMAGVYRCEATNPFGICSSECVVDIEGSNISVRFDECMLIEFAVKLFFLSLSNFSKLKN